MLNQRTFRPSDAHKLDDPDRLKWLPPADVIRVLAVQPGMTVADIGAGTGYFSIPFAREAGNAGRIFAVDLQPEMLEILRRKLAAAGAPANIEVIAGSAAQTNLTDRRCDLVFLANVWHELDEHAAVLRESARILGEAGRIAILDWRADVEQPPGPPLDHRIPAENVVRTLEIAGWRVEASRLVGQYSYLILAELRLAPESR
ncbi:MAG: class I SAM-dependent methyltransferase [Bryobacteraceae bacterium]|jgi:ubiquinone/menaquinone biosynthesis C-methylase UbiE